MFKKLYSTLVLFMLMVLAGVSYAADGVDVTAVVTGISDAKTAILSVIGALLGLSISIFGIGKVYSFVKRKAGA